MSAREAAEMLGISRETLYAYVTRKGIRSAGTPGSRLRRYWKADIERLAGKKGAAPRSAPAQSAITLVTERALFFRGLNAVELAETWSFEAVAALLWGVTEEFVLATEPTRPLPLVRQIAKLMRDELALDRASALFPLLEAANPRSYDLTPRGIAKTGVDIIGWYVGLTLRSLEPARMPLHSWVGAQLGLGAEQSDLVRRLLVLAADHGFEPGTLIVRGMASTGVTPWRSLLSGLGVGLGRRARTHNFYAINRFIAEIVAEAKPRQVVVQRIREGEPLPGFGSPLYPHGDPRAGALLRYCAEIYAADAAFARLDEAVQTVRELAGLEPSFAFACLFVGFEIGLGARESLFFAGRCAGWIAHAIEQHEAGESPREWGAYLGPLPQ